MWTIWHSPSHSRVTLSDLDFCPFLTFLTNYIENNIPVATHVATMNAVLPSTIVVPMIHCFLAQLAYWFSRTTYPFSAFTLRNVRFGGKNDVSTMEQFGFQCGTVFLTFSVVETGMFDCYSKDSCIGSLRCSRHRDIFGGFDMGLRE